MSLLSDRTILERLDSGDLEINNAYSIEEQVQPAGIDLRLGSSYLRNGVAASVRKDGAITINPGEHYVFHTIEDIHIPNDVKGRLNGRLSLSRAGITVNPSGSGLDPGFNGQVVLVGYNFSDTPESLKVGSRVVELELYSLDQTAATPYGQKESAQYQGQSGVNSQDR